MFTIPGLSENPTTEELINLLTEMTSSSVADCIDKEIGPVLEEVKLLGHYNDHGWREKFFNWLVNPERTVEEITYAAGPLAEKVLRCYIDDGTTINQDTYEHFGKCLGKAIAARNMTLEGPWEYVAWLFIRYNAYWKPGSTDMIGWFNGCFEDWIINMAVNQNLCPNPFLRLELLGLIGDGLVSPISDHNRKKYLNSIILAWSSLDSQQLAMYNSLSYNKTFFTMSTQKIYDIIETLSEHKDKILDYFDQKLSTDLGDIKSNQLSDMFHSKIYGFNHSIHTEIMELRALSAILSSVSQFASYANAKNDLDGWEIEETATALKFLVENFKRCCMMPQLIGEVTSSIFNVMYYVLMSDTEDVTDDDDLGSIICSINMIESVLSILTCPPGISNPCESTIGRELLLSHKLGFRRIKEAMTTRTYDITQYCYINCLLNEV